MKLYCIKYCLFNVTLFLFNIETVFANDSKNKITSNHVLTDSIGASNYFQMFFGLLLIVALIFGLAWLIRRINNFQGNMNGVLKVLSMISVGQREKVALIQVGNKQLLIGVSSGNVNTLLVLDDMIESKKSTNEQISFADRLSAVLKRKDSDS